MVSRYTAGRQENTSNAEQRMTTRVPYRQRRRYVRDGDMLERRRRRRRAHNFSERMLYIQTKAHTQVKESGTTRRTDYSSPLSTEWLLRWEDRQKGCTGLPPTLPVQDNPLPVFPNHEDRCGTSNVREEVKARFHGRIYRVDIESVFWSLSWSSEA